MSDIALSVRGLTKEYQILHNAEKHDRVTDAVANSVKGIFRKKEVETFRALDDVSFDVKKGEVLGVIGRNGAGKSTLLKVLSRITEPTSGEIHLFGRVGSLLEVGTGFHPELTGRENIFLNGAILGMRRREIERQFDEIVDFAEVEKFLDTPVKRYSSGMYVRLAFAVAAHLNPEILIVDEVLAVGDAQFQKKCLGKMQDVSQQDGRAVLFVSHNMSTISSLCTKVMTLVKGTSQFIGPTQEGIQNFLAWDRKTTGLKNVREQEPADGSFPIRSISIQGKHSEALRTSAPAIVKITTCQTPLGGIQPLFTIYDSNSYPIVNIRAPRELAPQDKVEELEFVCEIPSLGLRPGSYSINVALNHAGRTLDRWTEALHFEVTESVVDNELVEYIIGGGSGYTLSKWDVCMHSQTSEIALPLLS